MEEFFPQIMYLVKTCSECSDAFNHCPLRKMMRLSFPQEDASSDDFEQFCASDCRESLERCTEFSHFKFFNQRWDTALEKFSGTTPFCEVPNWRCAASYDIMWQCSEYADNPCEAGRECGAEACRFIQVCKNVGNIPFDSPDGSEMEREQMRQGLAMRLERCGNRPCLTTCMDMRKGYYENCCPMSGHRRLAGHPMTIPHMKNISCQVAKGYYKGQSCCGHGDKQIPLPMVAIQAYRDGAMAEMDPIASGT